MSHTLDGDANEQYINKVLSAGAWISIEFLEEVIGNDFKTEVKVLDFETNAAIGAGDNYLSILHKVKVNYIINDSNKILNLIIKGPPTSEIVLALIQGIDIFNKETIMYSKCLPLMDVMHKESFPENEERIAPYYYTCTREDTLVIEDLSIRGYKMANRKSQLDFAHCTVSLKKLARFHALSVKLYQENPQLVKEVAKETTISASRHTHGNFFKKSIHELVNMIEKEKELCRFSDVFRDAAVRFWDKVVEAAKPSMHFNVVNHGDYWTNNILFKYKDDGSVENAKIIDFQLTRYTTPAMDLMYFFFTSVNPNVLENHWHELFDTYYKSLTEDIRYLKIHVEYSKEQLYEDMRDRTIYVILILIQMLPMALASASISARADFNITELSLEKHFRNPNYFYTLNRYLTHMENVHLLEDLKIRTPKLIDNVAEITN